WYVEVTLHTKDFCMLSVIGFKTNRADEVVASDELPIGGRDYFESLQTGEELRSRELARGLMVAALPYWKGKRRGNRERVNQSLRSGFTSRFSNSKK
ncbi:unnamed protein product, partial [Clonostachys solani]